MKALKELDLSYFFLNNDKVIKEFGSYEADLFLIEKSLFDFYNETKNILFIVFPYMFIYMFNIYESPIILNPSDEDNPLNDLLFTYTNSFLYVQLWFLDKTKEKIINSINSHFNTIYNRLDYWKQKDNDNTYCSLYDTHSCSGEDCSMHGTSYCTLTHYLTAWDKLKADIQTEQQNILDDVNDYFNQLKDNTKQLFLLRLYWSFLLSLAFMKFPYLALEKPKKDNKEKKINNIDMALLEIYKNKHKGKKSIKYNIKDVLKCSDNAVNLYLYKLKKKGYISYTKDKIIINKAGYDKIKYLLGGLND